MWYLYLLLKSFTWKYHQKNYEIKSSSSKRNDWWATFIEYRIKKKDNEEFDNHEEKKNHKVIIFKKNKLIQNYHFDYFDKISKRKKKLITFHNQKV